MNDKPKEPLYVVVDIETTDREPANAHVVEAAIVMLFGAEVLHQQSWLFKSPVPIPPQTSAIHHIIDADVADRPLFEEAKPRLTDMFRGAADSNRLILVAHNAEFEYTVIAPLAPGAEWICTYKCALRSWPDAPSHSNEGLRYFLGFPGIGRTYRQQPHSALHDANVTTLLLRELLTRHDLETLLQWSREGAVLPRCPIGKYRDWKWQDIPTDYLDWILYKATDMRPDVTNTARIEMRRRHDELMARVDQELTE